MFLSHSCLAYGVSGWQSRGDAQLDQSCLRSHRGPARSREICCNSTCPCPSCETPRFSFFKPVNYTNIDFSYLWFFWCFKLMLQLLGAQTWAACLCCVTLWNVIGDTSVDRLLRPRLPPGWARIRSSAWWNQKWLTHVHTQPDLYTHTHTHIRSSQFWGRSVGVEMSRCVVTGSSSSSCPFPSHLFLSSSSFLSCLWFSPLSPCGQTAPLL